jgi:integrase
MPGWIIERPLKDGTLVYDIGYRADGRLVKRKGGTTRAEAETALASALHDVARGVAPPHATQRLVTYAEAWLIRRAPYLEPGTLLAYQADVRYRITPVLGQVRLCDLTAAHIEAAVVAMQKQRPRRGSGNPTYAAKTINNTLETLAMILEAAVRDGLLAENPARRQAGADRPLRVREPHREMRYLLPAEIARFLVACHPDYEDLAAVLAVAGLRISEALALEPRDIDLDGHAIIVSRQISRGTRSQLKDKTPRRVEIGPRLAHRLHQRIQWCRGQGHTILFPDLKDGGYLDRTQIRRRWHQPALITAGLDPKLRVHDLRHTAAAVWLTAGGQSLEYVRRQLGHKSIRQTQRYAHLERFGSSNAASRAEAAIWLATPAA